jgi:double zinc ribbon protein
MSTDPHFASCESCGKEFKVPDSSKTYSCNSCGGHVRALVNDLAEKCPDCGTEIQAESEFCTHCGGALSADEPTPSKAVMATPKPRRSGREREGRRAAAGELTRAFKFVKILRTWFMLNVAFHLLLTITAILSFGTDKIPIELSVIFLAINVGTTALMLVGYFQVLFRPFLWAVVLACLVTLTRAIGVISTDYSPWAIGFGAVWSLLFWALVVPTARIRKLMEANPDLHIAKRIAGGGRHSHSNRSSKESSQRIFKAAEKRAWRASLIGAAFIVTASVGSSYFLYASERTPSFDGVWVDFEADWRNSDVDQVALWFRRDDRDIEKHKLQTAVENRQWGRSWPKFENSEIRVIDTASPTNFAAVVEVDFNDGTAQLKWRASEGSWHLTGIQFPDPDFSASSQAWDHAWNQSDYKTLSEFFKQSSKMERALPKMAERRGWQTLPRIEGARIDDSRVGQRWVYLDTAQGEVRVRWEVQDDQWMAASIKPPKN